MSVYLRTGEGMSQQNLCILEALAHGLNMLLGQWIIAGDWNASPEELKRTGWLDLVGGGRYTPHRSQPVEGAPWTTSLSRGGFLQRWRTCKW